MNISYLNVQINILIEIKIKKIVDIAGILMINN
jgi:hypothetical protein